MAFWCSGPEPSPKISRVVGFFIRHQMSYLTSNSNEFK